MPSADFESVLSLVRDARVGGTFQERTAVVAESLGRLVPHTHLTVAPLAAVGGAAPVGAQAFISPALFDVWLSAPAYFPHYFEADPRRRLFVNGFGRVGLPSGRTLQLSAVLHPKPFGQDAFSGEYLRYTDTRFLVDLLLDRPDGTQFTFSLLRERSQGDFTPRQLRLLELVAPDLARMIQVAALEESFASPPPGLHQAAFVVDGRGEVLAARDVDVTSVRVLEARRAWLRPAVLACLAELVARAAAAGELAEQLVPVTGGWVRVTCGLLETGPGGRAMVTVNPVAPGSRDHFDAEATRGRLSPRERQVAWLALSGLGNREIARHLGTSALTIKHQLSSIYRKVGIQGRAGLPNQLLGRQAS